MGSGCSSVRSRGESRFYPGVYPGLKYHTAEYTAGSKGEEPVRLVYDHPLNDFANVEPRTAGVIDWPCSFVMDTVLLPWDGLYWALKKDKK